MGTDYFVRLVVGVPAVKLITFNNGIKKVQDTLGGIKLFDEEGKPITRDVRVTAYSFMGIEYGYLSELQDVLKKYGLSICPWSNDGLGYQDIIGVPLYDDDDMEWTGRVGYYQQGVSYKQYLGALELAGERLEKIGYEGEIKLYSVVEFNY